MTKLLLKEMAQLPKVLLLAFVASIALLAFDAILFVSIAFSGSSKIDPGIATVCGAVLGFSVVAWQTRVGFQNIIKSQENQAQLEYQGRLHQQELDAQSRDRQNAVKRQTLIGALWAEIVSLWKQAVEAHNNALVIKTMAEQLARSGKQASKTRRDLLFFHHLQHRSIWQTFKTWACSAHPSLLTL